MSVKSREQLNPIIGKSVTALDKILSFIRMNYIMDEFWDGKDELKFRRGGKTLATIYIKEGYFVLLLIFGKKERLLFEERQDDFPSYIVDYYNSSKTFHDGKWMFFDVYDETYVDAFIKMLQIKKKPNRKAEDLKDAIISRCGFRCDNCLLFRENSENGGNLIFQEGDWKCYHDDSEERVDYSEVHCSGCREDCHVAICQKKRGYESCIECDYHHCENEKHFFIVPGECNIGITNEDIEKFIIPYCAKERFDKIKNLDFIAGNDKTHRHKESEKMLSEHDK